MSSSTPSVKTGEYAERGDYHRAPDPSWSFYPTYLAKLAYVRSYLDRTPAGARVLDAGCGEGVLVEEYGDRLRIEGVDANYASTHVRRGNVVSLPFGDGTFDRVLCLDVLEHLSLADQPRALGEIFRVLTPGGEALISAPNLAHLQSRLHFLLRGALVRTASVQKHPGDRPAAEYVSLAREVGFELLERRGIFPTIPVLTRLIRRRPAQLRWLHDLLTRVAPIPGWCFLNLFRLRRPL
jgi:SAM-dependent methyltransferase